MRNIDSDISIGCCICNGVFLEDDVEMEVVLLFRYWDIVILVQNNLVFESIVVAILKYCLIPSNEKSSCSVMRL